MKRNPHIADALDVVNCARSFDFIRQNDAYFCPVEGGAYSHRPCRFFGMYRNKRVEIVAEIEAVIDVSKDLKAEVLWENSGQSESQLQQIAIDKAIKFRRRYHEPPIRVFLLSNLTPTNFVKDTQGGMQTSKMYLDVSSLNAKDALELAARLKGQHWSEFKLYRWN